MMRPPSAPKQEVLSKPEMTISPPVPATRQSVRRSRQSQVSPLQVSPQLPPGARSRQTSTSSDTRLPNSQERTPLKPLDALKARQQLLLSAGSRSGLQKGPEPLRRAIAECTGGVAARVAVADRVLQEYLSQGDSCALTYSLLLEHALAERRRSPGVVPRTVILLKRYLFRYPPTLSALQSIDAFCAQLMGELKEARSAGAAGSAFPSPLVAPIAASDASPLAGFCKDAAAVVKSMAFLRAVIARQLGPGSSRERSEGGGEAAAERQGKHRSDAGAAGVREHPQAKLEFPAGTTVDGGPFLEADMLSARWTLRPRGTEGKQQPAWAPSPVLLGSGGLSRPVPLSVRTLDDMGAAALLLRSPLSTAPLSPQGRSCTPTQLAAEQKAPGQASPLDGDARTPTASPLATADAALLAAQIRTVAAAKRRPEGGPRNSMEMPKGAPPKRRTRPLFNYRPYSDQQPLKLSDAEMGEVVGAVCSETVGSRVLPPSDPGGIGAQVADVAASVLLKLLLDCYLATPTLAGPLILRLLLDMLGQGAPVVRCRAFDLVVNLGVHAHLIDAGAMHSEDPSVPTTTSPSTRSGASQFESWVSPLVHELLLFLVHREEEEETVWGAALSCLLFFTANRGRVCVRKVDGLDVRIVAALLRVSRRACWADSVHTLLLRLAVHLLYSHGSGRQTVVGVVPLDVSRMERMGGVALVCEEYAMGRSKESRRNLFGVLFDLAVQCYSEQCRAAGRVGPSEESVCAVAVALSLAEAPDALALAFQLGRAGGGEGVRQAILGAMQRDATSGRLDAELLAAVTSTLDGLVATWSRPSPAFAPLLAATLTASSHPLASFLSSAPTTEAVSPGTPSAWRRLSAGGGSGGADALSSAWATLRALLHSSHEGDRRIGRCWLMALLATTESHAHGTSIGEGLCGQLRVFLDRHRLISAGDVEDSLQSRSRGGPCASPSSAMGVQIWCELLLSPDGEVQALYLDVLDRLLVVVETDTAVAGPEHGAVAGVGLLRVACEAVVQLANGADTRTVLRMCHLLLRHSCAPPPPSVSRAASLDIPLPALLLSGRLLAPPRLLAQLPVPLLLWPLQRLPATPSEGIPLTAAVGSRGGSGPGSSLSDVRAALLLLLITRCDGDASGEAFDAVGAPFFPSLLDDPDPRLAYYASTFLLRRMAVDHPDDYRAALQRLVFQAQQSNNEKLLENPYLQMRGLLREQALAGEEKGSGERNQ